MVERARRGVPDLQLLGETRRRIERQFPGFRIPIGLGLMGAHSASGTATIGDVHTYGVAEPSLMTLVQDYVRTHQPDLLNCVGADFGDATGKNKKPRFYLRLCPACTQRGE